MKKIITIGRKHGSGGREIGKEIARRLGIKYYDKELLSVAAGESDLGKEVLEGLDERPMSVFSYMATANALSPVLPINHRVFEALSEAMKKIASEGPCVFIGRCSNVILKDFDKLSVFVHAPLSDRIARVMKTDGVTEEQAKNYIENKDADRSKYYHFYTGGSWSDMSSYDLCIDSSKFGIEKTAELIAEFALEDSFYSR